MNNGARHFDVHDLSFHSRGSVIANGTFDVKRVVVVNEINRDMRLLDFKQDLVLLLETTTTTTTSLDDEVIKEGATHNDFYGFLSSCDEALVDAPSKKITRDGPLVKQVILTFERQYCARYLDDIRREKFIPVPNDWIIMSENDSARVQKWFETPYPDAARWDLSPRFAGRLDDESMVIWSSRNTDAENRALFEAMLLRAKALGGYSDEQVATKIAAYDENMVTA